MIINKNFKPIDRYTIYTDVNHDTLENNHNYLQLLNKKTSPACDRQ